MLPSGCYCEGDSNVCTSKYMRGPLIACMVFSFFGSFFFYALELYRNWGDFTSCDFYMNLFGFGTYIVFPVFHKDRVLILSYAYSLVYMWTGLVLIYSRDFSNQVLLVGFVLQVLFNLLYAALYVNFNKVNCRCIT